MNNDTITLPVAEYKKMAREILAATNYFISNYGDLDTWDEYKDEIPEVMLDLAVVLGKGVFG